MDNGGPWLPTLCLRGHYPTGVLRLIPLILGAPRGPGHLALAARSPIWYPSVCHSNAVIFCMCHGLWKVGKHLSRYAHARTWYSLQVNCECSSKELLRSTFPGELACSPQLQLMLTSPLFSFPTDTFTVPGPCHNAIYTGSREKQEQIYCFSEN